MVPSYQTYNLLPSTICECAVMDFVNKETFLWVGDESENKETREEKKASGGMRSLLLYFSCDL